MLTGGEAHDCPVGAELVLQNKPGKTLLGDKAYDSAELRASLKERGTNAVIPNKCNRKRKFKFSKKRYRERHRIEKRLLSAEGLPAHSDPLRQTCSDFCSLRVSGGRRGLVDLMSLDPRIPRSDI